MIESNEFDGGKGLFDKAMKMAKDVKLPSATNLKNKMDSAKNNMKLPDSMKGMIDSAKKKGNNVMDSAKNNMQLPDSMKGMMDSAKKKSGIVSEDATALSSRLGINGQHPILYILAFNFVLRVVLLFSLSIKPKAKDKIHLEHSKSALGVSLASICIAGYIHYVNTNADNQSSDYNEQLSALLCILLYVVILYDVLIPLFQKNKGKGKVAKKGSLAGLIILPGFLVFLLFFMSKEVDAKMELSVKILNENSIITAFFMFAAIVIISLVSFFTLYTQEANKKNKSSEDHMKLMKSYYIMLMMAVFILVLIIEYTL
jgi:hypothetical protein